MSRRREFARRLALEGLVIVASILAAFALDTWWDGVGERREEAAALESLHREFELARASVEFYRSIQARIHASVSATTDSLEAALNRGASTVELPDTLLGWAYIPPTTSISLGTLEGLVASGRLSIISDPDLRAALGSWGSELEELNEEEVDLRALAYGDMDRTLRARMNTNGLWSVGERLLAQELSPEEARSRRRVPVDTEVLGVFHLRESILIHALDEFEPLLEAVDSVVVRIERSR